MPFKRNPILSEKIDSLARYVAGLAHTAWENAAHSLLERTLDDSANRREILPTAFLACDELLITAERVLSQLIIDAAATQRNLTTYGPFAATERVLMAAARAGADRQAIHEHLRELSMQAWTAISSAAPNPLADLVAASTTLAPFLSESERRTLMDAAGHVGDAPARARAFAQQLVQELEQPDHATRTLERIRQDRSLSARFSAD
jgi:adenylosuccinate lyase